MDPGKDMVVEKLLEEKFKAFFEFAFAKLCKKCASLRNFFCSFAKVLCS